MRGPVASWRVVSRPGCMAVIGLLLGGTGNERYTEADFCLISRIVAGADLVR